MERLEKEKLYPLLFKPIYKAVMWGGTLLPETYNRDLPELDEPIGESWEIVDRDDDTSIVENGDLKGISIKNIIQIYGEDVMGSKFKGGAFPLLIKLIDAGKKLSLQVHPGEIECRKLPGAEPKTEAWYIVAAREEGKIIAGLNHKATKQAFLSTYETNSVEKFLQVSKSNPGDAYFIKAGTVHAIGAGNLILEIQQNSNTTYRISDWGRVDSKGNKRELHIEESLQCIDFLQRSSSKIAGTVAETSSNSKFPVVANCRFFKIDELRILDSWDDQTDESTFYTLTAIDGDVELSNDNFKVLLEKGRTCLVPSAIGYYSIKNLSKDVTRVIKSRI